MANLHVSLRFAELGDAQLDEFASNVVIKMTGNALFAMPMVTPATLGAAQVAFHNALAAMTQGGTQATATKNTARAALVGLLRQEANYVQGTANNNVVTALASGFLTTTVSHAQSPLVAPVILAITKVTSTKLGVELQGSKNAKAYEIQGRTATGAFEHLATFTSAHGNVLENLLPGTNYTLQARAVGGSTGLSNWSDPVSHMCT